MSSDDLTERVRARLLDLSRRRRFNQSKVAARLNLHSSAINRTLKGSKEITLKELEIIADEAQERPAELLAPPGTVKELNAEEAELLRFFRAWPKETREALAAFLRYFADESPAETQTRNVHQFWRGMKINDRQWVYGLMQMVREGILPPDLREGLLDRLTDELRKKRDAGGGRRRTDDST
jgi:transcriptional regulator with XRE-family HTH domain